MLCAGGAEMSKYCSVCGAEISEGSKFCPECSAPIAGGKTMNETDAMQIKEFTKDMDKNQKVVYYEQKKKSAGIAAILSFVIAGAGQMYLGKIGKGILLLLFCWLIIPWLYSIYDAYNGARDYNARLYSIIFSGQRDTPQSK